MDGGGRSEEAVSAVTDSFEGEAVGAKFIEVGPDAHAGDFEGVCYVVA